MSADQLQVELVSAERTVWSGQATMVSARTTAGDIGILRGHTPVLSLLVPSIVEIKPVDGGVVIAAVDAGFISVAANRVSILSEHARLGHDVDVAAARAELEHAQRAEKVDQARVDAAQAQLDAADRAS